MKTGWNVVSAGSMKPTVVEGDRILVNRLADDVRRPFTKRRLARLGDPSRRDRFAGPGGAAADRRSTPGGRGHPWILLNA